MMLWQLAFAVEGWNRVQSGKKEGPPPMSSQRFDELMRAKGRA